jgi:hypothetical protein
MGGGAGVSVLPSVRFDSVNEKFWAKKRTGTRPALISGGNVSFEEGSYNMVIQGAQAAHSWPSPGLDRAFRALVAV